MGFFKKLRPGYKAKKEEKLRAAEQAGWYRGPTAAGRLPANVLDLLFGFVCPHSLDETYLSSDDSMPDEGCTLCHTRDLAHCAFMNKAWAAAAHKRL